MNKLMTKWILGVAALAVSGWASAVPCSDPGSGIFYDPGTGEVSASSDCVDGDGNGPFGAGSADFFDMTYTSLQKFNLGDGKSEAPLLETTVNVGLEVTPENQPALSGTWKITNPGDYTDFVILLKGGNSNDPSWSAYQVIAGVLSGTWEYGYDQDLSHFSLFGKIGTTPPMEVPEPGSLALLGLGLLGFGIARRRRQA